MPTPRIDETEVGAMYLLYATGWTLPDLAADTGRHVHGIHSLFRRRGYRLRGAARRKKPRVHRPRTCDTCGDRLAQPGAKEYRGIQWCSCGAWCITVAGIYRDAA